MIAAISREIGGTGSLRPARFGLRFGVALQRPVELVHRWHAGRVLAGFDAAEGFHADAGQGRQLPLAQARGDATVDRGELDTDGHSVQPIADKEALAAYWRRWQELNADIAEAERAGCAAEVEELQREWEALMDIIKAASGLGGKQRAFGSDGDKLRPSVCSALRRVYRRMREVKPAMARTAEHLESSIVCEDNTFVYRGASLPNWRIIS